MTSSYLKSLEYQDKFKNRDQRDIMSDDDYIRYKKKKKILKR